MEPITRYYQQHPLSLPVHAVSVRLETKVGSSESGMTGTTFTVLRSRANELMRALIDVDFERLSLSACMYELHDAMQLLALQGPLCPVGLNADVTDAVPYASFWNAQDGRVRKLTTRVYRPHLVMKVMQGGKEVSGQPLGREELCSKVLNFLEKSDFQEIHILPGDGRQNSETLVGADERIVRLADLFDLVDLDRSGDIVLEEMRIVLKEKGYSDDFVEHVFYHMDLNKDKVVSRTEFYQALRFIPIEIFSSDRAQSDEQLLRYFDELDVDRNGSLSWPEFQSALLKRGMAEEFIKRYFTDLDLDQSKTITRDEYARCIGLRWRQD